MLTSIIEDPYQIVKKDCTVVITVNPKHTQIKDILFDSWIKGE